MDKLPGVHFCTCSFKMNGNCPRLHMFHLFQDEIAQEFLYKMPLAWILSCFEFRAMKKMERSGTGSFLWVTNLLRAFSYPNSSRMTNCKRSWAQQQKSSVQSNIVASILLPETFQGHFQITGAFIRDCAAALATSLLCLQLGFLLWSLLPQMFSSWISSNIVRATQRGNALRHCLRELAYGNIAITYNPQKVLSLKVAYSFDTGRQTYIIKAKSGLVSSYVLVHMPVPKSDCAFGVAFTTRFPRNIQINFQAGFSRTCTAFQDTTLHLLSTG